MAKERRLIDSSDARQRMAAAMEIMASKEGVYAFEWSRCREQRTTRQNAYWWGVVVPAIAAGISEAWGERWSAERTHEFLKRKFLTEPVVNRTTGEVVGETTGSSAALDTKQFGELIDKVSVFASEFLNVEVPPAAQLESSHA